MTTTRMFSSALVIALAFIPASALAADASIESITTSTKPTISGETDASRIYVVVRSDAGKQIAKKSIKVKDEEWRMKVSKTLKRGQEYEVTVYEGKNARGEVLAEETFTVGKKETASGGTLSFASVPLLFGGSAKLNSTVPVAYIKVTNSGTKETTIDGFTLAQNGSAAPTAVTSFSVNDDKGGSRATHVTTWKGKTAYVPLPAVIAPGQFRIFTVKATLAPTAFTELGKQLMLDVQAVKTDAGSKSTFPIRGTTWTITY